MYLVDRQSTPFAGLDISPTERIVLNRVGIKGYFCPKQGPGSNSQWHPYTQTLVSSYPHPHPFPQIEIGC